MIGALSHALTFPAGDKAIPPHETDIRAAIEGAPRDTTVRIPPGVFIFSEPIVLQTDNITVEGSGSDTVLRLGNNVNQPLMVIGSTQTTEQFQTPFRVRNITLKNLTLDGNGINQTVEVASGDISGGLEIRNNCLTIRGAEDIFIENVVTMNARSGGVVLEKDCRRINIRGFESYGNHFDGFAAYETRDSLFEGLHLHHNQAAGISLDIKFHNNTIKTSRIFENGSQGVFMRWSSGNKFIDVETLENRAQGVFIARAEHEGSDATNNIFEGVTIVGSGREGFRVNDATCTGNILLGEFRDNSYPNIIVGN
jgi:hypothetical protein